MNDVSSTGLQTVPVTRDQAPWLHRRHSAILIVLASAALLAGFSISRSLYDGRLANPLTHDDVNYFVEGIQHLTLLRTKGFLALVLDFLHSSLHAPLSTYQAMLAYLLFGITDWAPYASNVVLALIFLGFAASLLRDSSAVVLTAAMACLITMPLSSRTITEFNPESVCSLFTAIGAVLMVRLPVIDAPLRSRLPAALCFTLGFIGHPSAFPFTLIALLATVGLALLRDIVWSKKFRQLPIGIANSLLNILLSVFLPTLYMAPRYLDYTNYFYDAVFNPTTQRIWSGSSIGMTVSQHLGYYLVGDGAQYMFDHKFLAYAGIICLGFVAAWRYKDRQLLTRQAELIILAFLFWSVPTLAVAKAPLFALTFGFSIAFMTVIALQSISRAVRGRLGAVAVSALAVLLLVLDRPSSLIVVANLPQTVIDRQFAFRAIDQFKTVLLGNATNPRHMHVYMTNIGAYAPNMLQYYLLKTDPTLDWDFDSKWQDPNPREHLEFIRTSMPDFVIAGQRDNGLTNSPFASPAEDAVYDAMSRNAGYMAIDRFYGPNGREIAVFQRSGSFAGWRPISGIINWSGKPDGPRDIPTGLAYLQTFAARPVQADLEIEWVGVTSEQELSVLVNHQKVADLTFSTAANSSSLKQEISLSGGTNDVTLQSDHALTLRRLVIIPNILGKTPNRGISVVSATYGGNCGAPGGNATQDVVASCNGRTECSYSVKVERLGDPANGCGKDFAASYFCEAEATMRHQVLPAEAGFGGVLNLSCTQPENK